MSAIDLIFIWITVAAVIITAVVAVIGSREMRRIELERAKNFRDATQFSAEIERL